MQENHVSLLKPWEENSTVFMSKEDGITKDESNPE
jgi:hypothetical protein